LEYSSSISTSDRIINENKSIKMRKIFTIFLLLIRITLNAADHYVAIGDGGTGTIVDPFGSIAQVNAHTFVAGDNIYFNRGDTFYGTLTLDASGTQANRITFGAYGTGADPVITGFTTISGWTNEGGGIYSKAITVESAPNMVIVDGVNTKMGRYPKTGWNTIQTTNGSSYIRGSEGELPSSPDWDGGEVVIRKNHWIIDRNYITSHSGQTINYTSASGYEALPGYGYFIQNHINTLTTLGDWYYSSGTFYMYFGAVNPTTKTVKVSTTDYGITITSANYITVNNLNLQGFNVAAILITNCDYTIIQDNTILYSGKDGINSDNDYSSSYTTITGNYISDSQDCGIFLSTNADHDSISYNTVNNTGLIAGLNFSGDGHNTGIFSWGLNGQILYNIVTNNGYNGIFFAGQDAVCKYNYIDTYALVKDDAGGIYTASFDYMETGRKITKNIVRNCIGANAGTLAEWDACEGIYLDQRNTSILVDSNTVENAANGIFLHNSHEINIWDNTLYDCRWSGIYTNYDGLWNISPYGDVDRTRNVSILRNKIVFKDEISPDRGYPTAALWLYTRPDDILQFGTADTNYYTRPVNETSSTQIIVTEVYGNSPVTRTLTNWKSYSSVDVNSNRSLGTAISDTTNINFMYNATTADKNYTLSQSMTDVAGVLYSGTVTLQPYTSLVLLGVGTISPVLATLTTTAASSITTTTAISGGYITPDGVITVTARGVCWSTSMNPTTALATKTINGTGTGYFTSSLTGLTESTTYYVRAYATNSAGTCYGNEISFTTSDVTSVPVLEYNDKIMKSGGKILIVVE
jgi:parallel beta-helix repeat protein